VDKTKLTVSESCICS